MKTSTIAPALIVCLLSAISSNAGPIPAKALTARDSLAIVDALYVRDIEADILARAMDLKTRGSIISKPKISNGAGKTGNAPDSHASYPVGNNHPETPHGSRIGNAGRKDDYFGNWQRLQNGVDNPAAGKGKYNKPAARDVTAVPSSGVPSSAIPTPISTPAPPPAPTLSKSTRDIADMELEARKLPHFANTSPKGTYHELKRRDDVMNLEARFFNDDEMVLEARSSPFITHWHPQQQQGERDLGLDETELEARLWPTHMGIGPEIYPQQQHGKRDLGLDETELEARLWPTHMGIGPEIYPQQQHGKRDLGLDETELEARFLPIGWEEMPPKSVGKRDLGLDETELEARLWPTHMGIGPEILPKSHGKRDVGVLSRI